MNIQSNPAENKASPKPAGAQEQQDAASEIARLHDALGKSVLLMIGQQRYRWLGLGEMERVLINPLARNRVAIVAQGAGEGRPPRLAGMAIWANVSEKVDAAICDQINANVFPVNLKPGDWDSGNVNWILDIIAPEHVAAKQVAFAVRDMMPAGDIRIHPAAARAIGEEGLKEITQAPQTEAAE